MRALALGAFVVFLASLVAAVEPARACSCVPPDPWALLRQADGAFVGRLVSRGELGDRAILVFSVERAVKGAIGSRIEVQTPPSSAACGVEAPIGARIGLFLERTDGAWFGTLCAQVSADDMLAAAALPAPDGTEAPALYVGGRFGAARMIALDAKGRTLAYGLGAGTTTHVSVCPGGRSAVEIAARGSSYQLAVRDTESLRALREQPLRIPGRRRPDVVRCENSAGSSVLVFARIWCCDAPDQSAVYRLGRGRLTRLWGGRAYAAGLTSRSVYLCGPAGDGRDTVWRLDLRTRRLTALAKLESACARFMPDSTGRRLAGVASGIAGRSYITLIDLTRTPADVRQTALPQEAASGELFWLTDRRLLFLPSGRAYVGRVLDLGLRTRTRFPWIAWSSTVVGTTAFGVRTDRTLVAARVPSGPSRVIRRLPGRPWVIQAAG